MTIVKRKMVEAILCDVGLPLAAKFGKDRRAREENRPTYSATDRSISVPHLHSMGAADQRYAIDRVRAHRLSRTPLAARVA